MKKVTSTPAAETTATAVATATVNPLSKKVIAENSLQAKKILAEVEKVKKDAEAKGKAEKGKTEKGKKGENKKVDKPVPMAKLQDEIILKGGAWSEIISALEAEAKKRNYKIVINQKYLQGHVNRRLLANKEFLGTKVVSDKGVFEAVKKVSRKSKAA